MLLFSDLIRHKVANKVSSWNSDVRAPDQKSICTDYIVITRGITVLRY